MFHCGEESGNLPVQWRGQFQWLSQAGKEGKFILATSNDKMKHKICCHNAKWTRFNKWFGWTLLNHYGATEMTYSTKVKEDKLTESISWYCGHQHTILSHHAQFMADNIDLDSLHSLSLKHKWGWMCHLETARLAYEKESMLTQAKQKSILGFMTPIPQWKMKGTRKVHSARLQKVSSRQHRKPQLTNTLSIQHPGRRVTTPLPAQPPKPQWMKYPVKKVWVAHRLWHDQDHITQYQYHTGSQRHICSGHMGKPQTHTIFETKHTK